MTLRRHIAAPPERVYAALVDPAAVASWKVPDGMSAHVHELDARPGGRIRVSLTHDDAEAVGKTSGRTDTYSGRFLELVPGERVVEALEFETGDPALLGEMRIEIELRGQDGATELIATHSGLPRGVSAAENELGWSMSLRRLAQLVER